MRRYTSSFTEDLGVPEQRRNTPFQAGFVSSGAHYVAVDFSSILDVAGDLGALVSQVRRANAWIYRNAHTFGGDPERLYIGGHSSGAHLAAAALTTDWRQWDTPSDVLKGGILMSGMYDLYPVHLSARSRYVAFDNAVVNSFSPCRHISWLSAPIVVAWGTDETPPNSLPRASSSRELSQVPGNPQEHLLRAITTTSK